MAFVGCSSVAPVSVAVVTRPSAPVCVCVSPLLLRAAVILHLERTALQCDCICSYLIMSAGTLCPREVTLPGPGTDMNSEIGRAHV